MLFGWLILNLLVMSLGVWFYVWGVGVSHNFWVLSWLRVEVGFSYAACVLIGCGNFTIYDLQFLVFWCCVFVWLLVAWVLWDCMLAL